MTTSRRDTPPPAINKEGQPDFRGIMRAIKAEATETDGAKSKNDLVDEYKNDCSEELRTRMEGVMRRDAMDPHESTVAPTFDLKRMGSDERVDLSSFTGDRPVALTFSSYT